MMLLLDLAHATDPEPALSVVETARAEGIAALRAKEGAAAVVAYSRCLETAPDDLDCRWQRGWAWWVLWDWSSVVADWEQVAAVNPGYESIATQLPLARAQLDLVNRARAARELAPKSITAPAPPGRSVRIRAVGDMMIGTAFPIGSLPPDDGLATFAAVADLLRDADTTFGNLEGPLCDNELPSDKCKPDATPGSCYAFRTPTSYGQRFLDAGFDVVSTANNHAGDFGDACRTETESTLNTLGILWSGRPGTVAEWEVNELRVGLIAFHTNIACNFLNDTETAAGLVRDLAARNDLVLVSFHGGAEGSKALHVPVGSETFYGEDRGDLRAFTHAVVDAGADLVLGHGPHVPRAIEVYQGRLIAYSLGNFATYERFNLSGNQALGVILEVTLSGEGTAVQARLLGTKQVGAGIPEPDPENRAADLIRALAQEDFPTTAPTIAQDGTIGVVATPSVP